VLNERGRHEMSVVAESARVRTASYRETGKKKKVSKCTEKHSTKYYILKDCMRKYIEKRGYNERRKLRIKSA
jgi:hypothetical protein